MIIIFLGIVSIDGKFNGNYNIVYIFELFGDVFFIEEIRNFIICLIILLGYKDVELNFNFNGIMLIWKEYGWCVVIVLKFINKFFVLVGSFKGVMIVIYIVFIVFNLVIKLVFYRILWF